MEYFMSQFCMLLVSLGGVGAFKSDFPSRGYSCLRVAFIIADGGSPDLNDRASSFIPAHVITRLQELADSVATLSQEDRLLAQSYITRAMHDADIGLYKNL
jgi:hypothetical protein